MLNMLISFIDNIKTSLKNNKDNNIWDIAENNANLSLNILDLNNGYKQLLHLYNVFNR